MTLLKISNNYINIDSVIHIIDEDGVITLFFNTENGDRPYYWAYEGEEARVLRDWLNQNSTHL